MHPIDVTLVIEEDGTIIAEDEILMACQSQTLLLLTPKDEWMPAQSEATQVSQESETAASEITTTDTTPLATPGPVPSDSLPGPVMSRPSCNPLARPGPVPSDSLPGPVMSRPSSSPSASKYRSRRWNGIFSRSSCLNNEPD